MDLLNFVIILSVVILVHELGHFLAAKFTGIKVEEFGLGYPPRIFGKKFGETIYSLNLLPFGGFVRMFGEQEADTEGSKNPRAFFNKSKKQRSLVILAGVVMNLLLAVVCFSFIYSVAGIPEEVDYIMVDGISANSPAEQAGINPMDRILSINGQKMQKTADFVEFLKTKKAQEITLDLERDGQEIQVALTPRQNPPEGEGAIGVIVSNYDNIFYPKWQMPFRGTWVGIQEAYGWTKAMFVGLGQIIKGLFMGEKPEVRGVVGIYQITSAVAEQGTLALVKLVGILSINLAVINILPFPALDGGRFIFILLEKVIGKKIKPKIEAYINMAGMVVLIALMVLVTVADVIRVVNK
jgi:regulator of sigma E protease